MARRYFRIKGPAKNWIALGVLLFLAWSFFGTSLFNFRLSYFSQGYQTSFFRSGHFERQGPHWMGHDLTLGRIVTLGDEVAIVDVDAKVKRGTMVIYAWRWPAFLHDQPSVLRTRIDSSTREHLEIPLDSPGLYVLSLSSIYFGGDVVIDWQVGTAVDD